MPMVNNAIIISAFPEKIIDWIWETKKDAFSVW